MPPRPRRPFRCEATRQFLVPVTTCPLSQHHGPASCTPVSYSLTTPHLRRSRTSCLQSSSLRCSQALFSGTSVDHHGLLRIEEVSCLMHELRLSRIVVGAICPISQQLSCRTSCMRADASGARSEQRTANNGIVSRAPDSKLHICQLGQLSLYSEMLDSVDSSHQAVHIDSRLQKGLQFLHLSISVTMPVSGGRTPRPFGDLWLREECYNGLSC